jgi:hypothetical protein
MLKFKFYKNDKDIPTYKGMKCYFDAPLLGIFSETNNYYYILKYSEKEDLYLTMMHDELHMTCMNGGMILDPGMGQSRYQADEYNFETLTQMLNFLGSAGFDEETLDDTEKLFKKLHK